MVTPFRHSIGDRVTLNPLEDPNRILARSCGGFGAVYVVQSTTGFISAVKTIREDLAVSGAVRNRFVLEAGIWRDLPPHPSVLPLFHVWTYEGQPYAQMEYVPPINEFGSSAEAFLAAAPDGGVVRQEVVLLMALQLVRGLEHLEKADPSFVHGDIKPSNVLLKPGRSEESSSFGSHEWSVGDNIDFVLSDFGMARAAMYPGSGAAGDLRYLAPEVIDALAPSSAVDGYLIGHRPTAQYLRESLPESDPPLAGVLGFRSDVFALGATLFEMLLGKRWQTFADRPGSTARSAADVAKATIMSTRSDVSPLFSKVLVRCLAEDPSGRFESYSELMASVVGCVEESGLELIAMDRQVQSPPDAVDARNRLVPYLERTRGLTEADAQELGQALTLAASNRSLGRIGDSMKVLRSVNERVPEFPPVLGSVGHNLMVLGYMPEAIRMLSAAVSRYESDPDLIVVDRLGYLGATCNLAQMLASPTSESDPERALELAEQSLRLGPEVPQCHFAHGMALLLSHRLDEAQHAFETGYRLDPKKRRVIVGWLCAELLKTGSQPSRFVGPEAGSGGVPPAPARDEERAEAERMAEAFRALLGPGPST